MSYTDYLKRKKINSPQVIDTQMRMPDASAYIWRKKMALSSVNRRTDHVINNVQDPNPAPTMNSKQVMGYAGSGFGGKVQDASSYTMSRGATAIGQDNFTRGRIVTNVVNTSGRCLASTPASQVVSEFGNADGSRVGLNMGYTRQRRGSGGFVGEVGLCTSEFRPLTKSYFVDTIPDVKLHKVGSAPQRATTQSAGGRQTVQNAIICTTTNTSGVLAGQLKADVPFNSYSEPPHNPEKALFVTGVQGPQVGGVHRAEKVGGAAPLVKHSITHRGNATPMPSRYAFPRVPPRGAPAQLKINDPNHYKTT